MTDAKPSLPSDPLSMPNSFMVTGASAAELQEEDLTARFLRQDEGIDRACFSRFSSIQDAWLRVEGFRDEGVAGRGFRINERMRCRAVSRSSTDIEALGFWS